MTTIPLMEEIEDQDRRFSRAFDVLRRAIAQRAFPGASVAITHQGKIVALHGLGRFTYQADSSPVVPATVYDLASVTKVVATTALCMSLYEHGSLKLETRLVDILPEFGSEGDPRRKTVTLRMLLAHSSGLPAYVRLFETVRTRDDLLQKAMAVPLEATSWLWCVS